MIMADSKNLDEQRFGGIWTAEKMDAVQRYLEAFSKVMKNQLYFDTIYIDAFAGSGECKIGSEENHLQTDGSAIRSLKIEDKFDNYVFVELNNKKLNLLKKICENSYADIINDIEFIQADANKAIQRLLEDKFNDKNRRGVIFLDPFGASVTWETLEKIASTKTLDVWYLFPLSATLRFSAKDFDKTLDDKLDACFGTTDWRNWYDENNYSDRTVDDVLTFFSNRLKSIFPLVLNPVILKNSNNSPMFAMYFAMANDNPKALKTALRIADYILRMFEEKKLANDIRPKIEENIQKDKLKQQKKKSEAKGQPDLFDL